MLRSLMGMRSAVRLTTQLSTFSTLTPRNVKLAEGILQGNRTSLARAITLVESQLPAHQKQAQLLIDQVLDHRRLRSRKSSKLNSRDSLSTLTSHDDPLTSFRLGIAGPPGAGKSTFIEALGLKLTSDGHRVAVIAIDPSSSRAGGSILGDKTRMMMLSRDPKAFVRPAATWGTLGGLAQYTNDVILLCEACGYDIILVETVGLGQSEVDVDGAVDMCMLLLPPATGDDLQGVKKGIMEVADLVVINKSDGELATPARHAASSVRQALQLSRPKTKYWKTKVLRCSALMNEGVPEVWDKVREYRHVMTNTIDENTLQSELIKKRSNQSSMWMLRQFQSMVLKTLDKDDSNLSILSKQLKRDLIAGHITPRAAASKLFDEFRGEKK
jgi:LAO/AO transport system kinase